MRVNVNLLILFKQDTNLKHVHIDINIDMSYEDFCELYRCCFGYKSMDS